MVDPLSAAALTVVLKGVLDGATEKTGASALTSLVNLLRRHGRRDELTAVPAEVTAQRLADAARADQRLAGDLRTWVEENRGIAVDGSTRNRIDGTVHGPVVQGRDFEGPITFGR
jgi:hypothetical protein